MVAKLGSGVVVMMGLILEDVGAAKINSASLLLDVLKLGRKVHSTYSITTEGHRFPGTAAIESVIAKGIRKNDFIKLNLM